MTSLVPQRMTYENDLLYSDYVVCSRVTGGFRGKGSAPEQVALMRMGLVIAKGRRLKDTVIVSKSVFPS